MNADSATLGKAYDDFSQALSDLNQALDLPGVLPLVIERSHRTDISYVRTRSGARLFFRNVDGVIQIVGKTSKANEDDVIDRLMEIYDR